MFVGLFGENILTMTFQDIFESYGDFKDFYDTLPESMKNVSDEFLEQLYYNLYAQYGNSHISNADENQFKFRMFTLIFREGPIVEKKMEVQDKLRKLDIDSLDVLGSTKAIYNHAYNDGGIPTTDTTDEIDYINEQNTTKYVKTKLDGYAQYYEMISNDVMGAFVKRFKDMFIKFAKPQVPLLYKNEEE